MVQPGKRAAQQRLYHSQQWQLLFCAQLERQSCHGTNKGASREPCSNNSVA